MSFIAAGAALLGGVLGRNSRREEIKAANRYNNPKLIRRRYEKAGFNPLLGVANGSVPYAAPNYAPQMGDAIARAGSAYAAGEIDRQRLEIEQSALAMDRERLDHLLASATLQPNVRGIYGNDGNTSVLPDDVQGQLGPDILDIHTGSDRDVSTRVGTWLVDPTWSQAEDVEREYAEVGSYPFAAAKIVNDIGYNGAIRFAQLSSWLGDTARSKRPWDPTWETRNNPPAPVRRPDGFYSSGPSGRDYPNQPTLEINVTGGYVNP